MIILSSILLRNEMISVEFRDMGWKKQVALFSYSFFESAPYAIRMFLVHEDSSDSITVFSKTRYPDQNTASINQ